MSVPVSQRGEAKLEVFTLTLELVNYTLQITTNENVFLPKFRNALTDDIIRQAKDIYINAWSANGIYVDKSRTDFITKRQERFRLQELSIQGCNNMFALIQMAHKVFHLKGKRVKYWANKVANCKTKLIAWHKKDIERFN